MKIAVTGATGHVGANLVRALLDRGHTVRALVRRRRGLDGLRLELVDGDLNDDAALERAFAGAELVYHAAARISIVAGDAALVRAVNVDGTRKVAETCLKLGVRRLVHFSSIHALDPNPAHVPIDETRPLTSGRVPHYDRSKAAAEQVVADAVARGLDAVIVTPTAILGPHDYAPSRMGQVLVKLHQRRLPALVDGGFDWVDVRDVVAGALAAATRGKTGERYILSGTHKSVRELCRMVAAVTGVRAPRLVSPMWLARVGAPFAATAARLTGKEPLYTRHSLHALRHHQLVSHAKATRELAYAPRPLEETLAATYAWLDRTGALAS